MKHYPRQLLRKGPGTPNKSFKRDSIQLKVIFYDNDKERNSAYNS